MTMNPPPSPRSQEEGALPPPKSNGVQAEPAPATTSPLSVARLRELRHVDSVPDGGGGGGEQRVQPPVAELSAPLGHVEDDDDMDEDEEEDAGDGDEESLVRVIAARLASGITDNGDDEAGMIFGQPEGLLGDEEGDGGEDLQTMLDVDEDARFLEVCVDGDVDDLVALLEEMAAAGETLTPEMLNYVDASGRSPVSHLCGNGMIEMLELLEDIPNIDYNAPDAEGNAPLHFAAQAGHVEVVAFLLNKVRTINVDPVNKMGFTPLMKSALQGRIKCSKLLLFSGASPIRRDRGRGLTPAQWARFCGRNLCADSIEKFVRTAVPDGEALMEEAGAGAAALDLNGDGKGHRRGNRRGGGRGAKNKDLIGTVGSFFRSRSVGSRHRPSWIVRKINKLASSSGNSDSAPGSAASSHKSFSLKERGDAPHHAAKLVAPRVKVTPAPDEDLFGGGGVAGEDTFWSDDPESSPPGGSPTRSLSGSNERLPDIKGKGGKKEANKAKKKKK